MKSLSGVRIMRYYLFCFLIMVTSISTGCSVENPAIMDIPDEPILNQQLQQTAEQAFILDSGSMNLETCKIESFREPADYLNVTPFLGNNFWYENAGYIPPDQYFFKLNIENTSGITVHDVSIVFDELYGKSVINPDSYIDIYEPYDLDPYTSFRKADPIREFPGVFDTQPLIIRYPSGTPPFVDYFIIAHLGGNTGGVYEIDSALTVDGQLYSTGGSATLYVTVRDHQDDVSIVVADTSVITGGYTFFESSVAQNIWEAEITNSMGAPAGTYEIILMANSPSAPSYNTYQKFELEIL